jgi:hypothetical protein
MKFIDTLIMIAKNRFLRKQCNISQANFNNTYELHEEIVERFWKKDDKFKNIVCSKPFKCLQFFSNGDVHFCTNADIRNKTKLGNLFVDDLEKIYNSPMAKKLRKSIIHGSFEYCGKNCKDICEFRNAQNRDLYLAHSCIQEKASDIYSEDQDIKNVDSIAIDFKNTNIYPCFFLNRPGKRKVRENNIKWRKSLNQDIYPLLKNCTNLTILNAQELKSNMHALKFIKKISKKVFPNLQITLDFNINKLKSKNKFNIKALQDFDIYLSISTTGQYNDYSHIKPIINNFRSNFNIKYISVYFPVSSDNYKNIENFIQIIKEDKISNIFFDKLRNLEDWDYLKFNAINVCAPAHPEHLDMLKILQSVINQNNDLFISTNIL